MAETNFGVNHPLSRKLWQEKLTREALKMAWVNVLLGDSSEAPIQVIRDLQKNAGDRVRLGLRMQLTTPGVLGDDTLEGNESDLTFLHDYLLVAA